MAVAYVVRYRDSDESTIHVNLHGRVLISTAGGDDVEYSTLCGLKLRGNRSDFSTGYSAYVEIVTCKRCRRSASPD